MTFQERCHWNKRIKTRYEAAHRKAFEIVRSCYTNVFDALSCNAFHCTLQLEFAGKDTIHLDSSQFLEFKRWMLWSKGNVVEQKGILSVRRIDRDCIFDGIRFWESTCVLFEFFDNVFVPFWFLPRIVKQNKFQFRLFFVMHLQEWVDRKKRYEF